LTGFLHSLEREGREGSRAFYLEAWNGDGRFTYDRIGRGTIDIEAACVSILGGIQPGPLTGYMLQLAKGLGGDDGLMQRFQLLVWPDVTSEWVNVDREPDISARRRIGEIFDPWTGPAQAPSAIVGMMPCHICGSMSRHRRFR
jgi:putative DNA primase/helicase